MALITPLAHSLSDVKTSFQILALNLELKSDNDSVILPNNILDAVILATPTLRVEYNLDTTIGEDASANVVTITGGVEGMRITLVARIGGMINFGGESNQTITVEPD